MTITSSDSNILIILKLIDMKKIHFEKYFYFYDSTYSKYYYTINEHDIGNTEKFVQF